MAINSGMPAIIAAFFLRQLFFDLRDLKQKIFTCVCPEEAAMEIQTAAVSSWLYEFPKRHFLFGL